MPVDVAVEQPGSGIVSDEPQSGRLHRQQLDCITAEWVRLSLLQGRVDGWIIRSVIITAVDDLEFVAVNVAM